MPKSAQNNLRSGMAIETSCKCPGNLYCKLAREYTGMHATHALLAGIGPDLGH